VNSICGGGLGAVSVTCEVYPVTPATQVPGTGATLTINGTARSFSSSSGNNPLTLTFSVGGASSERALDFNTIVITVTDNNGTQTIFTFFIYKGASSTTATTPVSAPIAKSAKRPAKPERKYAKGKR